MAQNPHEYLIEQLQFTGDETVGSTSNKVRLNFNHPCKELVFVAQPTANVDYCTSFECGQDLHTLYGAQPFNYSDALDVLPNSISAYSSKGGVAAAGGNKSNDSNFVLDNKMVNASADNAGGVDDWCETGSTSQPESAVSDAGAFVLAETGLKLHCWGQNPVVTAKLQLNGQDRFSEREGSYFDTVQPYQHHPRTHDTGINV